MTTPAHHRPHAHLPGAGATDRAFALGVFLNVGFVVVEAGFGFTHRSLALLADAGHNLGDVLGLLLAWGASALARWGSTDARTFGLRKTTVMAALVNGVLLLGAVGGIVWEAVRRLGAPEDAAGPTIMAVAAVGIVVNTATMLLFRSGRKRDLNVRGAFLHMAADAVVSLGVVAAGAAIAVTGALWIDPVVSLAIAAVILVGTWSLLAESANLAVDAVPRGIDTGAIRAALAALPGVEAVHDLHIWGLSTTETALTAHLVRPAHGDDDAVIRQADTLLRRRFGIGHTTLQIERTVDACPTGTAC